MIIVLLIYCLLGYGLEVFDPFTKFKTSEVEEAWGIYKKNKWFYIIILPYTGFKIKLK